MVSTALSCNKCGHFHFLQSPMWTFPLLKVISSSNNAHAMLQVLTALHPLEHFVWWQANTVKFKSTSIKDFACKINKKVNVTIFLSCESRATPFGISIILLLLGNQQWTSSHQFLHRRLRISLFCHRRELTRDASLAKEKQHIGSDLIQRNEAIWSDLSQTNKTFWSDLIHRNETVSSDLSQANKTFWFDLTQKTKTFRFDLIQKNKTIWSYLLAFGFHFCHWSLLILTLSSFGNQNVNISKDQCQKLKPSLLMSPWWFSMTKRRRNFWLWSLLILTFSSFGYQNVNISKDQCQKLKPSLLM